MAGGARAGGLRRPARARGDFASAFSDVFEDLFGGLHGRPARWSAQPGKPRRGPALQNSESVSENAYSGLQKQINVPTAVACGVLAAERGRRAGRSPSPARPVQAWARCARSRAFSPWSGSARPVRASARSSRNPCKACGGAGRVQKDRALSVNIPAGVETGTRIRLSGEGEAGTARRAVRRSLHLHRCGGSPPCFSVTAWTSTAACLSR